MGGAQLPVNLFLYGTLRHRPLLDLVAGAGVAAEEASLPGFRVVRERGGVLPVLVGHAEGSAHGLLLRDVPPAPRARLDAYEVPWGYAPCPVTAVAADGPVEALAYAPPEGFPATAEDWSLDAWLAEAGPLALRAAEELAALDPFPDGDALRRQWPMIAHRAAASLRARGAAPTARRRRAAPGDVALRRLSPPAGAFFRFEALEASHRRFDGATASGLRREALVGCDAALLLPFDRRRGRVLLVEQVRTGPARRGDPQPWLLEPVAGLVDAHETPEEAARREAVEEAGLHALDLVPMFRGYASPGNATDFYHAFLGLCDLPDGRATSGGLAEEAEDLRLHVLPLAEAMALLDTGEANAVPLISMLLWLDRWLRLDAGGGGA